MRTLLLLVGLASPGLMAQVPNDFAYQWPFEGRAEHGLFRAELSPEVYAHVQRDNLGDLVAFNGSGEVLALQVMAAPGAVFGPPVQAPLPMFRLPATALDAGDERIALFIERGSDGRLRTLQADVGPETTTRTGEILLLDASGLDHPLRALRVELDGGESSLDARVSIEASSDLSSWRSLGPAQALVRLRQDGLSLERNRIELPGERWPYLRLRRTDKEAPLPIRTVSAIGVPMEVEHLPSRRWVLIEGEADAEVAGRFRYRLPGPVPVDRLAIAPGNGIGAFRVSVLSEPAPGRSLHRRGEQVAFQVGEGEQALRSDPLYLSAPVRDRIWKLDTDPPQSRPPRFDVGYMPEQVLLLASPPGPYHLAAGSGRAERPELPLGPVLSTLRAVHGANWLPPLSPLGEMSELSGALALGPEPHPLPLRQIFLWLVLGGGGLLVVFLCLRLLRGDAQPGSG